MINVNVINGIISDEEADAYRNYAKEKYRSRDIESIDLNIDGDFVDVQYHFKPIPFERIRRITGYLVGTTEHFNDAKKAEERDRIKHSISCCE